MATARLKWKRVPLYKGVPGTSQSWYRTKFGLSRVSPKNEARRKLETGGEYDGLFSQDDVSVRSQI